MENTLYFCKVKFTNSYMKQLTTYLNSAPQTPIKQVGGGIFCKLTHNFLLRLSCMLCPLIVGAAFFVS
jgi:hypothetical protein